MNPTETQLLSLLQHSSPSLSHLKQIHALGITLRLPITPPLLRALLRSCPPPPYYALKVFDEIPQPDLPLCSSLISTYSRLSLHKLAIRTFFSAHNKTTPPDRFAFPPVLKSCALTCSVPEGQQLHSLALRTGFGSNPFIQTSLIDLYWKNSDLCSAERVFGEVSDMDPVAYNCLISAYSKSGRVVDARRMFDEMPLRTIASWNSMISCYAHNGDLRGALGMFELMQTERAWPNEITLVTVLSACAKLGDLGMGLRVKKFMDDNGMRRNMIVSTALLEMYVKCGAIEDAQQEFEGMGDRDVVAWSTMIAGYAQNGRPNEALQLFELMKTVRVEPNDVTLVSALSACSQLGAVEIGKGIGKFVEDQGLGVSVYVGSALVDMYAKCGNIRKARQVFNEMPEKDVVSWNSMIGGLAVNGYQEEAINLYSKMIDANFKPNDITFVALLTACTHAGLVEMGCQLFESMKRDHNIVPQVEHCACIVDLFCRSNQLKRAYHFICNMEVEPNVVIWGSLLSASRINSDLKLAECAAEKLLMFEPENSGNYILLSNLYVSLGKWEESLKVRTLMKEKNVQKTAAYSWIELDGMVHKFLVDDTSHPKSGEIYNVLGGLSFQLKLDSFVSNSVLELSIYS